MLPIRHLAILCPQIARMQAAGAKKYKMAIKELMYQVGVIHDSCSWGDLLQNRICLSS